MDFAITLDNQSTRPLHRQLYEELRRSILSGRLLPGQRIPSSRALARSLGVSRITVTQSYEALLSEGYLQATHGSGTFICRQLPEELLRPSPVRPELRTRRPSHPPARLSTYGASVLNASPSRPSPSSNSIISFRYWRPDTERFPLRLWARLMSRHCKSAHHAMLDYAVDLLGHKPLREAIARYLAVSRAVQCEADQVIIVNGSQQALDLTTRVLLDRGNRVALEDPGYTGARQIFLAHGARLWPVPVDKSGLVVKHLSAPSAADISLVYVTPSHQFPTGALLSLPRRLELLAWAKQRGAVIIEDDYDSEYRYSGRPVPALQGLDQSHSVIYIGTFSKVLFPALRIGYLVVPWALVPVFERAKWVADRHSPTLEQYVLADFIDEGHLERHIRRMRTLYDRRRQTLVRALTSHLGARVTILGESAGMHLMAQLRTRLNDDEIINRAAQAGVELVSSRSYYLRAGRRGEFIFGFADLSERKIQEGVRRLSRVFSETS